MKMKLLLLCALMAMTLSAANLEKVYAGCEIGSCSIDFSFDSNGNLPRYHQKWNERENELQVLFKQTTFGYKDKSFKVPGSQWLKNVYVHNYRKGTVRYQVFRFRFIKTPTFNKVPVSLINNSEFKFTFKNISVAHKAWTLKRASNEVPVDIDEGTFKKQTVKAQAKSNDQEVAIKVPKVVEAKVTEKSIEKKPSVTGVKAKSAPKSIKKTIPVPSLKENKQDANTFTKMSYSKNRNLKRFYLSFLKPDLQYSYTITRNIIELTFTQLKYTDEIKSFSIPTNDIVRSITYNKSHKKQTIRIVLHANGDQYRLFNYENKIILQSVTNSVQNQLVFWSNINSREEFVQAPEKPEIPAASLEDFEKSLDNDSDTTISLDNTFALGGGVKELIAIGDRVSVRSKPTTASKALDYLNFGKRVTFLDIQDNWFKITYNNMTGYVFKTLLSYEDKLTEEQGRRLMKQVNASFAQLKKRATIAPELALTVQEVANNKVDEPVGVDLHANSAPVAIDEIIADDSSEKIKYSTFGRRDPFIPVTGPDDSGINIDGVKLVGIIWDKISPIAILEDVRNTGVSYTLQVGDKILNGKVERITATEIVFLLSEFGVQRQYSMALPEN
ncbi:MAG: SH3 domain-containing protein [Fibrobacterales bacterium]